VALQKWHKQCSVPSEYLLLTREPTFQHADILSLKDPPKGE